MPKLSNGRRWKYSLWENDEKVFEGFDVDLRKYILDNYGIEIHLSNVRQYAIDGLMLLRKYKVTREACLNIAERHNKKPKPKKDAVYNYVVEHLDKYGNTCLNKKHKIDAIIKKLEKDNIKVKARYVQGEVGEKDGFYILEVINEN